MLDFISPKFPRELVRPTALWRKGESHVMGAVNNYTIGRYRHLIPYTHLEKVCLEYGEEGHGPARQWSPSGGSNPGCSCGRSLSWFVHFCVNCGDFFIRDFSSPKFCAFYATCWNCLPSLPWAYCLDHGVKDPQFAYSEFPPIGLNPRKWTDDDLREAGIDVFEF